MGSFVEALFSACIAGALVWFVVRRGNTGGGNASTTAEIDRLRAVVEELSASLERRAEAAEQRLGKVINEAQAVQSVLDRALTAVGTQLVRPETTPESAPRHIEAPAPARETVSAAPAIPEEAISPSPVVAVEQVPVVPPIVEALVEPVRVPVAPMATASTPPSDLLHVSAPAPEPARLTESLAQTAPAAGEGTAAAAIDGFAAQPIVAAAHPPVEPVNAEKPAEPVAAVPVPAPVATPLPPSRSASGVRDPKETVEREARVMSLVARGITNSVDIVRQTGLTRGEVELILTLHNLHIAPGPPVMPPSSIPEMAPEPAPAVAVVPGGNLAPGAAAQAAAPASVEAGIRPLSAPTPPAASAPASGQDDRYAAIYALIAAGITDSVEIARRTGLGRGEVELHMGLHARNVL